MLDGHLLHFLNIVGRPISASSLSDVPSYVKTFSLLESDLSASAFLIFYLFFIKFWICLNFPFPAAFLMRKTCCQYSSIQANSLPSKIVG